MGRELYHIAIPAIENIELSSVVVFLTSVY